MKHALIRFIIHLFSSTGAVLALFWTLRFLQRVTASALLPLTVEQQLEAAALIVFAASTLREAWDVSRGQSWRKAVSDYVSWAGGCAVSAWGLIRLWRITDL